MHSKDQVDSSPVSSGVRLLLHIPYNLAKNHDNTYDMPDYKFTAYFENEVLRKRPYVRKEWCIRIIENPIRVETQGDSRVRFWGKVKELGLTQALKNQVIFCYVCAK